MWLWDSVFHSIGMNNVYPKVAWDFLKSILDFAAGNGKISGEYQMNGETSLATQPPILSWGVWQNYLFTKNLSNLKV